MSGLIAFDSVTRTLCTTSSYCWLFFNETSNFFAVSWMFIGAWTGNQLLG